MVKRLVLLVVVIAIAGGTAYTVHRIKSEHDAADLAAQSLKKADISVTIIEGKRREEIAAQLEAAGITPAVDFLAATVQDEGKLFPDTYRFFPNTAAADVVSKMTADYATRTSTLNPTNDQLVLASIIEREASNDAERPVIAEIYYNRLAIGMKLQSDPTVQYGKDTLAYQANPSTNFTFWKPIVQLDYTTTNSTFNTYQIDGLPPAPICNPGLASIQAAISPSHDHPGYLFFYEKNGQLLLAKTLAEHNAQASQ